MHPILFYGQDYQKQKEPGTSYQSLFGLQNMLGKIYFLMICHLSNFNDLIQSGFSVIPKIMFASLYKPIHVIVIIPFPSDSWNLEAVERRKL